MQKPQRLAVAIIERPLGGAPTIIASSDDVNLVQSVLESMIASVNTGVAQARNSAEAMRYFSVLKTLREHLGGIG